MASCAFCKEEEAPFYEYGVPICADCLDVGKPNPDRTAGICFALVHDLTQAAVKVKAASIQNASRELAAARKEKDRAHRRLHDYLSRRIVPEDLRA